MWPNRQTDIIPLPQECTTDTGGFQLRQATTILVDDNQQTSVAWTLANLLEEVSEVYPTVYLRSGEHERGAILFQTDQGMPAEYYRLDISPSHIWVRASDERGFFYAVQTIRCLLTPEVREGGKLPGVTIYDGPQCANRIVLLQIDPQKIPVENMHKLIDYMAMFKINRLHFQTLSGMNYADSKLWEPLEHYASLQQVKLSFGKSCPKGEVARLPFLLEQALSRRASLHEKELIESLANAAEQGWCSSATAPSKGRTIKDGVLAQQGGLLPRNL